MRYGYELALPFLVGLRAADPHVHSLVGKGEVLNLQTNELGSTESSSHSEQDQCAIAFAGECIRHMSKHCGNPFGCRRLLGRSRRPDRSADASHDLLHTFVFRRRGKARLMMEMTD